MTEKKKASSLDYTNSSVCSYKTKLKQIKSELSFQQLNTSAVLRVIALDLT